MWSYKNTYDHHGNKIAVESFNSKQVLYRTLTYMYDDHGNVIEIVEYLSNDEGITAELKEYIIIYCE